MKITYIAAKRPVTTMMFFVAIVLLGFVSLSELSVDLLPDISYPRLSVVTQYPGVAPEEIETIITDDLEAAVSRIPGLRRVESVSKEGFSYMILEFAWGTDMDFAMLHTREALDGVQLPDQAEDPTIIPFDPQSKPILVLSISGDRSLLELKEFSEELVKPRLEQIEGIGSAEIAGGVEREIHIEVNPRYLTLYGLTIDEISNRIDAFNQNLQGGTINKGRFRYALRVVGEFEELDEIGEISIKTTRERGVIRLKDVAEIRDSIKERQGITRLNGRESIGILVRKEAGANTVKVTQTAREILEDIQAENPSIEIFIVSEQAKYIENAISSVRNSILFGGILAFLVLFVFLQDFKTPMIIAGVIPIAIIATFNLLYYRGITLNIMSLGGLALGIGMLVDNSIVVSESIFRHRSSGKSLFDAAVVGTREVGMAVTASTLTTISVFLPVIYVHGVAGQLFKDQALTVTFAMLSSLIVSLTLLPMLASRRIDVKLTPRASKTPAAAAPSDTNPGDKTKKKNILLFPFRGLRWLLYNIPKGIFWVLNLIFSFVSQLLLLLFHYLSLPFRPVIKAVFKAYNAMYARFEKVYHATLEWSLAHKGIVIFWSLIFLGITAYAASRIPRELMPKPESVAFEANLKTPVDYSMEQTSDIVRTLEVWLKNQEAVKATFSQVGIVSGMEALNPDISLNSARLYIEAYEEEDVEPLMEGLRQRMYAVPGMTFSLVKEQSTLAQLMAFSTAEIGLKIKGDDLNRLRILAEQLVSKLESVEGITDISTNLGEGKPEFLVSINKQAIEKYGIFPAALGNYLSNAVGGRIASEFKELEKKYDILVRLDKNVRENIDTLLNEPLDDLVKRHVGGVDHDRPPGNLERRIGSRSVATVARRLVANDCFETHVDAAITKLSKPPEPPCFGRRGQKYLEQGIREHNRADVTPLHDTAIRCAHPPLLGDEGLPDLRQRRHLRGHGRALRRPDGIGYLLIAQPHTHTLLLRLDPHPSLCQRGDCRAVGARVERGRPGGFRAGCLVAAYRGAARSLEIEGRNGRRRARDRRSRYRCEDDRSVDAVLRRTGMPSDRRQTGPAKRGGGRQTGAACR